MYKKVLLAYDGSIEGRRALREGAKLAQSAAQKCSSAFGGQRSIQLSYGGVSHLADCPAFGNVPG